MKRIPLIFCIMATAMIALTGCSTTSSDDADTSIVSGTESSTTEEISSEPDSSADDSSSSESDSSSSAPENSSVPESGSSSAGNSTSSTASSSQSTVSNTNKSAKERAQGVYAASELDIKDWNTPAVNFTAGMNQMCFTDEEGYILALYTPVNAADLTSKLKNQGFYDSRDTKIGAVKAFNDYRGVETDIVNIQKLDNDMENYICYRYDASTDSFTEVLIPVNGSGSSTDSSSSDSSNSSSDSHNSSESSIDVDEYANEMVDLANAERKKAGVPEVSKDSKLMELAAMRAEELATSYSHTRPNGEGDQYTGEPDYEWVMCNIGRGQKTPSEVVSDWMNSSGHKRNMLYEGHDSVGAGCYQDSNGKWYWCIMFYADGGSYPDY